MSRRTSVHISGFHHLNPVPNASRIDGLMMSGLIGGFDLQTRAVPKDFDEQLANMLAHVEETVRAAGGSLEDIIKMTVWLRDFEDRTLLNERWLEMFPDPDSLPARQVFPLHDFEGFLVICDITAVIDRGPAEHGQTAP